MNQRHGHDLPGCDKCTADIGKNALPADQLFPVVSDRGKLQLVDQAGNQHDDHQINARGKPGQHAHGPEEPAEDADFPVLNNLHKFIKNHQHKQGPDAVIGCAGENAAEISQIVVRQEPGRHIGADQHIQRDQLRVCPDIQPGQNLPHKEKQKTDCQHIRNPKGKQRVPRKPVKQRGNRQRRIQMQICRFAPGRTDQCFFIPDKSSPENIPGGIIAQMIPHLGAVEVAQHRKLAHKKHCQRNPEILCFAPLFSSCSRRPCLQE